MGAQKKEKAVKYRRQNFRQNVAEKIGRIDYFVLLLHPKKKKDMQVLLTILLLIVSNIFMTFAWYGHLKLREFKFFDSWPLFAVILFSWGIALFEYCFQVPANRIGFRENGGPFSLMQLKVIQEVITLVIFTIFSTLLFKGESLHWNHFAAFGCLVLAVYFVFMK